MKRKRYILAVLTSALMGQAFLPAAYAQEALFVSSESDMITSGQGEESLYIQPALDGQTFDQMLEEAGEAGAEPDESFSWGEAEEPMITPAAETAEVADTAAQTADTTAETADTADEPASGTEPAADQTEIPPEITGELNVSVNAADLDLTYDGKDHFAEAFQITDPETNYIAWFSSMIRLDAENHERFGSLEIPVAVEPGEYNIWYYVAAQGYEPVSGQITIMIRPIELTAENITLEFEMAPYRMEVIKPAVTVTDPSGMKEGQLEEGVDYLVSYSDNFRPGTAKAVVRGIGIYSGVITKTFQIYEDKAPQDIQIGNGGPERTLEKGKSFPLDASAPGELSYEIDDESVASVDAEGNVTMYKEGTVQITITAAETDDYMRTVKRITITFKARQKQKITAKGVNRVFISGRQIQITASASTKLSYESMDPAICTVDENGVLTMIAMGETKIVITAEQTDEYVEAKKTINVRLTEKREQKISKSRQIFRLTFKKDRKVAFTASAKGRISYASSDENIFVISKTGELTLKKPGIAYIEVTARETSIYKEAKESLKVTVYPVRNGYTSCTSKTAGRLTLKWRLDSDVTGYELQLCQNKDFTGQKLTARAATAHVSTTVKNLEAGKRYYARIRSYVDTAEGRLYGSWSAVKSAVIKK